MMNKFKSIFFKALIISTLYVLIFNGLHANELKIYSERQPLLIEPLLEKFEDQSGIKVEWIYSQKGLVQKAILEKMKSDEEYKKRVEESKENSQKNSWKDVLDEIIYTRNGFRMVGADKLNPKTRNPENRPYWPIFAVDKNGNKKEQ